MEVGEEKVEQEVVEITEDASIREGNEEGTVKEIDIEDIVEEEK